MDAKILPAKAVFRIPNLSVRMDDMGDSKKVAPTAAEPTRDASIPAAPGFSSLICFSNSTNTVPNELIIPNIMPLQRKLDTTTSHACK